ncbi:unnamed protein product [Ceratitis capitata]|uniref:(Mediterranean fruit fly) hypothetical protein n=1 Tax=Ceratitis capitata TaxID=7213 RepID=A0A811V926_CERCA|nr:unnamed protein product [Ceratitis capitata]
MREVVEIYQHRIPEPRHCATPNKHMLLRLSVLSSVLRGPSNGGVPDVEMDLNNASAFQLSKTDKLHKAWEPTYPIA